MLKKVETKIKKNKIKEIRRNARKYNNCHLEQKEKIFILKNAENV